MTLFANVPVTMEVMAQNSGVRSGATPYIRLYGTENEMPLPTPDYMAQKMRCQTVALLS